MEALASEYGRAFADMMEHMESAHFALIRPDPCTVSTMTFAGKLGAEITRDEAQDLLQTIRDNPEFGFAVPEGKSTFLNQVTIKSDKVSVKIFFNGSVQVTGLKSVLHFMEILSRLTTLMDTYIESFSICLINATANVRTDVPLLALKNALNDKGQTAAYDPDNHPAVQIKTGGVTVLCFKTGNCLFFGARHPHAITQAYDLVCSTIDETLAVTQRESFCLHRSKLPKAAATAFRIIDGFDSHDYMLTTFMSTSTSATARLRIADGYIV